MRQVANLPGKFTVFDTETTGFGGSARMVEICLVALDDNFEIVDRVSSLVKSPKEISPGAFRAHGIRESELRSAPNFEQLWPHIHPFLERRVLVAHNAEFDLGILQTELSHLSHPSLSFNPNSLCTVKLARQALRATSCPPDFKLQTLCQLMDINLDNHHQATADVLATVELFTKLIALDPHVAQAVMSAKATADNLHTWPKSTPILSRSSAAPSAAASDIDFSWATVEQVLDRLRSNSNFRHVYVTGSPTVAGVKATDDASERQIIDGFVSGTGLEHSYAPPGARKPAFLWVSHNAATNVRKVRAAVRNNVPILREVDAIELVNLIKRTGRL